MAIFAIGDLHLSFGENVEKPMCIFGEDWINHEKRIAADWQCKVKPQDTVIIVGDISWGLRFEDAKQDLDWIDSLPGKKILIKGNHDLWWQSLKKLNGIYKDKTLNFLQNNCFPVDDTVDGEYKVAVCGTRGWICPGSDGFTEHDEKIYKREVLRLEMSLQSAREHGARDIIVAMHFPPTNDKHQDSDFTKLLSRYNVKMCIYGHIHGKDNFYKGIKGVFNGVNYGLVSQDFLEGKLKKL